MGFLLNAICDILYAPAVKADDRRAHEAWQESERRKVAQWHREAKEFDCWYDGSTISGPDYSYWSDGSIKIDGWTKDYYPKGMYYLNSRGQNAVLKQIPPGAKRCPYFGERLKSTGPDNPPAAAAPIHSPSTVDKKYLPDGLSVIERKGDMILFSYGGETVWEKVADDTRVEFVRAVIRAMYKLLKLNGETERAKEWKNRG